MSMFGRLLKTYRERAGLSQGQLSIHAGLSASTISRVEKGERGPLRKRSQVMALAKALGLKQAEVDLLLSAADLAPSTAPELSLHPRDGTLYRIAQELEALRTDARVTPAQVRFVEETLLLVLRGARAALPLADLSALPSGVPPARTLSEEERYLDDLLGDFIAGRSNGGPLPFTVLSAAARSPHWELKRRLAEAFPALLAQTERGTLDAGRVLFLIKTLRQDPPDPEWHTDIRRRVIEAMPALWLVMPTEVAPLLCWREGDEVYAALATLDVLSDIGNKALDNQVRPSILEHIAGKQRQAVTLYARVLGQCAADPDAAIRAIVAHRDDDDRLIRICMARPLHRLLELRPAETLKMMRYVLRRDHGRGNYGRMQEGQPAEHQNVRRAVVRAVKALIVLLDGPYDESALHLLRTLIADQDVHIRRAFCDALIDLVKRFPDVALSLIEAYLLQDRDHFVHERTWSALRHLMNQGSERAEELCARMIEIA